jgi:hypothetical protein
MNLRKLLPLLLFAVVGCAPRRDSAQSASPSATLGEREDERVMLLALDLSPSFRKKIVDSGEAYVFAMHAVDRYFRDTAGTQDRLVIASLSGSDQSLIWEGKPLDLRRQFPTPDAFRDHLISKADPGAAHIYKGLRHAMQYVFSDHRVSGGKTKAAVIVISSMNDDGHYKEDEEGYMNHEICELGWRGGAIGFYFVDQQQVVRWREKLLVFGLKNSVVESEIVGKPLLPSFD